MADIPGIIEGASEGKGLGLRFLRHIERNSLLLFMVPGDTDHIAKEYDILLNELRQFTPGMLDKHRVLAVTKCDLLDEELMEMLREELPDDLPVVFISAVTGYGIQELKDLLWEELNSESNKLQSVSEEGSIVHRDRRADSSSRISLIGVTNTTTSKWTMMISKNSTSTIWKTSRTDIPASVNIKSPNR